MIFPSLAASRLFGGAVLGLFAFACHDDNGAAPGSQIGGKPAKTSGGASSGNVGGTAAQIGGGGAVTQGETGGAGGSQTAGGNVATGGSTPSAGGTGGSAAPSVTAGGANSGSAGGGAAGAGGDEAFAGDNSQGGAGGADSSVSPDDVFRPSTRFTVVNPKDYGAKGDDATDDSTALEQAFAALPATGGIVLFPAGTDLKDRHLLRITKSHTLLWAPNRRATVHGTVRSRTQVERDDELCGVRQQAIVFQQTMGGGVYGLRFTSNAAERTSCAEDCQMTLDTVDGMEIVGTEVNGGPGCSVFAWSSKVGSKSQNLFVEGNYFHHTYADSIHHTHGARHSSCWRNYLFNAAPSLGDDGIACVTYSPSDPRCGDMEWWGNFYLGGAHGRGMAVIGGEDISIHHNWIVGSAAAGLIVASESAYTSGSSERIELRSNYIVDSPNGSVNNGHSSILISGGNPDAEPLRDIESIDNVIVDAPNDRVERAEGSYDEASVVFDDSTDRSLLPGPVPTLADVEVQDTSILRTRDVSFVVAAARKGLYRIHLREAASGGLDERLEYIVTGASAALSTWLESAHAQGAYVSENRAAGGNAYALLLSPVPLVVPASLSGVTFDALRAGDRDGTLTWLWARVDQGRY
jgi:hypothetical protein